MQQIRNVITNMSTEKRSKEERRGLILKRWQREILMRQLCKMIEW